MKKYFYLTGIHLMSTTIIYMIVYAVISFTIWEFKNPFQWIIDLPIKTEGIRFMILFYYVLYTVVSLILIAKIKKIKI